MNPASEEIYMQNREIILSIEAMERATYKDLSPTKL